MKQRKVKAYFTHFIEVTIGVVSYNKRSLKEN